MIRWLLADVLDTRDWSAYKLAQEADITIPSAYKLANPNVVPARIDVDTLNKVCGALGVQPGELLKWVADPPKKKAAKRRK